MTSTAATSFTANDDASQLLRQMQVLSRENENMQIQLQRREYDLKGNEKDIIQMSQAVSTAQKESDARRKELKQVKKDLKRQKEKIL